MAGYRLEIYIREDGYPEWQHCAQEWHLTPAQQETCSDLHTAYKALQRALAMQQHIVDSNAALRALKERTA